MEAWSRLFKILAGALLLVGANAVAFLRVATVDLSHVPPIDDRTIPQALFFAIQTVTTTGYGVGFTLNRDASALNTDLMYVACVFMVAGSIVWGILVAKLASLATIQILRK